MVGGYVLKDDRRLGAMLLTSISSAVNDELYEKVLVIEEVDAAGNVVERERRTTVNYAMNTCRRAWNVASRCNPGKVPVVNPFAAIGLESSSGRRRRRHSTNRSVPREGDRDGLAFPGNGRADHFRMVAAGDRHLRDVRGRALPAEGAAEFSSRRSQKDARRKLVPRLDERLVRHSTRN
jgi:hypothetical protein